ncbi:MAG: carboxypeptidase-like regulatory domain-containing protein [bacterium]
MKFIKNKKIFLYLLCLGLFLPGVLLAATSTTNTDVQVNAKVESTVGPVCLSQTNLVIASNFPSTDCNTRTASLNWETQYIVTNTCQPTQINPALTDSEAGVGVLVNDENIKSGNTGTAHTIVFGGLTVGQQYKYYLKSSGSALTAQVSGVFDFVCQVVPPTVTAIPLNKQAVLTINYHGTDVARVIIKRSVLSTPQNQSDGDLVYDGQEIAKFSDTVLMDLEKVYYYSVFACDGYGTCSGPGSVSVIRNIPEVLNYLPQISDGQVIWNWVNPNNRLQNDFIFSATKIIRVSDCQSNEPIKSQENNSNSFTDSGLTNGQSYYYKIFVKNSFDEYSHGICLTATPNNLPTDYCLRSNAGATGGDSQIQIFWVNPASDANFSFDRVEWKRGSDCSSAKNTGQIVYSGTNQSYTDTGLTNGQAYYYNRIIYYNNDQTLDCDCVSAVSAKIIPPEPCPTCVYRYYVNGNALEIMPDTSNNLYVLSERILNVKIPKNVFPEPVSFITANINNQTYYFSPSVSKDYYELSFVAPVQIGQYDLNLKVTYVSQKISVASVKVQVLPYGEVRQNIFNRPIVTDATVYLYKENFLFGGYGVNNPIITNLRGLYGAMVPNGQYIVKINKSGYQPLSIPIAINNNVVNKNLDLDLTPLNPLSILDFLNKFRQNPNTQKVNKILAPIILALAIINTLLAIPWWDLLYYLQFLFTEPLAWLFQRKRKGWGTVYNSITKKPIDLAVVRLYYSVGGKPISSRVTDAHGRYYFLVGQGDYRLEVTKKGFSFPTQALQGIMEDNFFTDIYHGETIKIREEERGIISANIPIDQDEVTITNAQVFRKAFWKKISENSSIIGLLLAFISLAVTPTWIFVLMLAVHIILFLLFRRLAHQYKPRPWGIIFDKTNSRPLNRSVARIFSPQYNRMLEAQLSDRYGRYGFLADSNVFYVTASHDGYEEATGKTVDLTHHKAGEAVGYNLLLKLAGDKTPEMPEVEEVEQANQMPAITPTSATDIINALTSKEETKPAEPILPKPQTKEGIYG